jgi:hypothetical protein
MQIKKFCPALLLGVLTLCAACAATPELKSYLAGEGVIQYFIPPTGWKARGVQARLDITYRSNTDTPATVNISFLGEKTIPRKITSVSLNGNGSACPLTGISVMYPDPDRRELRITSQGDRNALAETLAADTVTLAAEIDGAAYTFTPDSGFKKVKDSFLTAIAYQER